MGRDRLKEAYLKGYAEGLRQAWTDVVKLASKGYTATEMGIIVRGKLNGVDQAVEAMERRLDGGKVLEEDPGEESVELTGDRGTYLVREAKAGQVFELFRRLTEDGSRGLCITRTHPSSVMSRFGLKATKFIWLSRTERVSDGEASRSADFVSPTNLSLLASSILDFLDPQEESVLLLEGVEYLTTQNDFRQVLRFVQTVNEKVILTRGYFLLSVNPAAMNSQDYELLARESQGVL